MFLIVLISIIITIITWYQLKYGHRNALLKKIPSPKKYPLVHNLFELAGKSPREVFDWFESTTTSLGPIYHTTFDPFDNGTAVISDPKMAEEILSSQKLIDKGDDYELIKPWLGSGLLISTGKKWHQRRKILTPAFHFQILEKFVEIMDEQGKVLIGILEKYEGKKVDVFPLVNLYALDVICESAMGCKIDAQNKTSEYVSAVKVIAGIFFKRIFSPIYRINFFYQFTELRKQELKTLKILHGFTDGVIKARREELISQSKSESSIDSSGTKKKMALLDLLLQSTVDGKPLTNMDIREEVDTFMFEGHDTTTSGISFCLYNIAKYPEVQRKVFEEIQTEIGNDEVLTLPHLNKLHYLELVIKESLRLYPSVPYYARKLSEEATIGKFTMPKNFSFYISPYLMGRDPKNFPDPLAFIPERFDVETTADKVNPFAYVPFSAGPRNCVGQKFAMYEMKSIVCKIVRHFKITVAEGKEDLGIYDDLIMKTSTGVILNIEKR